ncbi:MAG: signal recognition particle protein [candidate division Zixibacteria bacterium CG_4_9_14_3_um_filter_46_8]|nr:MAG: signal recognition particle protein [candidate division Zixibacteria bacterium CG_4_9_14_3_um_filter_46_8]
MFDELSEKLERVFKTLRGAGKLTEQNIRDSLREVRRTLLEADVNYKVAKDFIQSIETKAIGQNTLRSINPGQQVIKIVHQELITLLGGQVAELEISPMPPTIIMLCGLQGSGKTTLAAKLALHYRRNGKNPLLVAADIYRPAAIQQLKTLGKGLNIEVFYKDDKPVGICRAASAEAINRGYTHVLFDTAGRLHIDDQLMQELADIKKATSPIEILLVADTMTGQDAVNIASEFDRRLGITGVALTKLDGDARGGAALSIRAVVGKPIKVVGVGEKLDALEKFYPDRMASRILGMGDIVSLVEKAQQTVDLKEAARLTEKLQKESFTLEDFYSQLQQLKKMGPLESLLEMIPGIGKSLKGINMDGNELVKVEAILNSMTVEEKREPHILNGSRRHRVARGSGTSIQDVNSLLKQFSQMQKMLKKFTGKNMKAFAGGLPKFGL